MTKTEFIETLFETGSLWFTIAALISSDNDSTVESYTKRLEILTSFNDNIDDATKIPEEDRTKAKSLIENGIDLLTKELDTIKRHEKN